MKYAIRIISLALIALPAYAADSAFLQAVNFALTARDSITVEEVNHEDCVFRVGSDIYYLNNVSVDRIIFQSWRSENRLSGAIYPYVSVELHGAAPVIETTEPARQRFIEDPALPALPALLASIRAEEAQHPELYVPHQVRSNEHKLKLGTSEEARLERAWNYVYSHGCRGEKSPF